MKFKETFLQPHNSGFGMWQIAEDNGDEWYDMDELIERISENVDIVEWEDWDGEDPRGSIYNETNTCWIRPTKEGTFVCILDYPVPESVHWYELYVYDDSGSRCGTLGDYMSKALTDPETYEVDTMEVEDVNYISKIVEWPFHFIAAENEEPSANSPETHVDWVGFREEYRDAISAPKEVCYNPREDDNLGTMVCFHRRYNLGDKHDYRSEDYNGWDEVAAAIKKDNPNCVIIPLNGYDHSGLSISTGSGYPFNDMWDAGQLGFIYASLAKIREAFGVKRVTKKIRERAEQCLEAEVELYNRYLNN